uniref:Uncharacterized protein n=1 Tax=Meloidogyne javanica TaxID=6303 RepID=A0A915M1Q7_MELJA
MPESSQMNAQMPDQKRNTGLPVTQINKPNYYQQSYQQNQFNQKQKLNTTGFVNQSFAHGGPSSSNNHDQNLQQNIYPNNHRASIDGIYNIHGEQNSFVTKPKELENIPHQNSKRKFDEVNGFSNLEIQQIQNMKENLHNFGHPSIFPKRNQEFIGENSNSINNLAIEESTMENHTKNTHGEDLIEQNHHSVNTFMSETKNEFARQKAIVKETLQVIRSDSESQKEFLEFFKKHNKALEQLKNRFESKQHLINYSKNFGHDGGIKINEQNNMNLHNYGNSFVFDQHTRILMEGSSKDLNHLTATELQKENYLENIKQKNLKDFQDLDKIHQLLQMQNLKNKHIVQKTPNNPQHNFQLNSPSGKTLFEIINENTQSNPMLPNEEHGNQRFTGTLDDIVNKSKRIMD